MLARAEDNADKADRPARVSRLNLPRPPGMGGVAAGITRTGRSIAIPSVHTFTPRGRSTPTGSRFALPPGSNSSRSTLGKTTPLSTPMSSPAGKGRALVSAANNGGDILTSSFISEPSVSAASPIIKVSELSSQPVSNNQSMVAQSNEGFISSTSSEEIIEEHVLPGGWEQLIDHNSGSIYYFNADLNVTQWERPSAKDSSFEIPNESTIPNMPLSGDDLTSRLGNGQALAEQQMTGADGKVDITYQHEYVTDMDQNTKYPVVDIDPQQQVPSGETSLKEDDRTEILDGKEATNNLSEYESNEPTKLASDNFGTNSNSALPAGWIEIFDDNVGCPYFLNEISGVTQWDRPTASETDVVVGNTMVGEKVESAVQTDKVVPNDESPPFDDRVETDTYAESSQQKLPDGWEMLLDESSGLPYYVHSASGTSQWDAPTETSAPVELNKPFPDDGQSNDLMNNSTTPCDQQQSLEIVNDIPADSDDNCLDIADSVTDQEVTIQEHPSDSGFTEDQIGKNSWPSGEELNELAINTDQQIMEHRFEPNEALPTTQIDGKDDISGERLVPESLAYESNVDQRNADENNDQSKSGSNQFEPMTDAPLQSGWIQLEDKDSGLPYYVNNISGATQWERPTVNEPRPVDGNSGVKKEIDFAERSLAGEAGGENNPSEYHGEHDEGSPFKENATNSAQVESTPQNLPDGWDVFMDESTGLPYYVHDASGTVQWDKPTVASSSDEPNNLDTDASENDELRNSTNNSLVQQHPPEEHGGEEYMEPEEMNVNGGSLAVDQSFQPEGAHSLINDEGKKLNETDFVENRKDVAQEEPTTTDASMYISSVSEAEELPTGWVAMLDESSGLPYYVHEIDGTTQWDRPTLALEKSVVNDGSEVPEDGDRVAETNDTEPSAIAMGESPPKSSDGAERIDNFRESDEVQPAHFEERDSDGLPAGWIQLFDEGSGLPYYFCEYDGSSQWEPPSSASNVTLLATEDDHAVETPSEHATVTKMDDATESRSDNAIASSPANPIYHVDADSSGEKETGYGAADIAGENGLDSAVTTKDSSCTIGQKNDSDEVIAAARADIRKESKPDLATEHTKTSDELPEGWVQLYDESSERPFYFCEVDGSTQWDRPAADGVKYDTDGVEALDSSREGILDLKTELQEPLTSTDGDLGNISVIHFPVEETDHTPVGIPEEPNSDHDRILASNGEGIIIPSTLLLDVDTDRVAVTQPVQFGLPEGWIKEVDESSGTPYFVNEINGSMQWEPPTPVGFVDAIEETVINSEENEFVDGTTFGTTQVASNVDDNEHVCETEHDIGLVSSDASQAKEVDYGTLSANGMVVENSADLLVSDSVTKPSGELPAGWIQLVDEASGLPYYFREEDGFVQWEHPVSVFQEGLHENVAVTNGDATNPLLAINDPNTLDYDEPAIKDPTMADASIHNTNDSDGNPNVNAEDSSSFPTDNDGNGTLWGEEVHDSLATGEDGKQVQAVLPAGWIQLIDESSGLPYYFSEIDGSTSWEPPSSHSERFPNGSESLDTREADTVELEVAANGSISYLKGTDVNDGRRVLDSVIPLISGDDGKNETPESDEIKEQSEVLEDEKRDSITDTDEKVDEVVDQSVFEQLPDGWTRLMDATTGLQYYFNEGDGSTQWEPPSIDSVVAPVMIGHSGMESSVSSLIDFVQDESTRNPPGPRDTLTTELEVVMESEQELGVDPDPIEPLPAGWAEVLDEDSGVPYYLCEETNVTQWDRPRVALNSISMEETMAPQAAPLEGEIEGVDIAEQERLKVGSNAQEHASAKNGIHRSARAFALFGFGGRLSVYRSQQCKRNEILIYRVFDLIPRDTLVRIEKFKNNCGVIGPLSICSDAVVRAYIEKVSGKDRDLLWSLIRIASDSRGKLRSDDGVIDESSPESKIVRLLLQAKEGNLSIVNLQSEFLAKRREREGQADDEILRLLLQGLREEAVASATDAGCHALALLVALMCSRESFQLAGKAFASSAFASGHPLCTVVMLFSGNLRSDTATEFWELADPEVLRRNWCAHVAAIVSNRVSDWEYVLIALGDRLATFGDVVPAHVCYMVCGCPVSSPHCSESRLTLLGCEVTPYDLLLRTDESMLAMERTEAFEWSKRRGNKNATIPILQSFKLTHAMLLADCGFEQSALAYAVNLMEALGYNPDDEQNLTKFRGPIALHVLLPSKTSLLPALVDFEDRLKRRRPSEALVDASFLSVDDEVDDSFVTAATNIMNPKLRTQIDEAEVAASEVVHNGFFQGIGDEFDGHMSTPHSSTTSNPEMQRETIAEAPDDVKLVTEEPASYKSEPAILLNDGKSTMNGLPPIKTDGLTPHSLKGPGRAAPLDKILSVNEDTIVGLRNDSLKRELETPPATTGGRPTNAGTLQKKPPSAPVSAPANLERLPKKSPSSGGLMGLIPSFRDSVTQWLNPEATKADLGEQMEAYYDPAIKRWVFPGDDPTELAKPIGPPPITPVVAATSSENSIAPPGPTPKNDPLSAMMMPPSRIPSAQRSRTPAAATASGLTPATFATPPAFTVFTSKAGSPSQETNGG